MQKLTTAEVLVPFLVFMAGTGGTTLAALYYPDKGILLIIGLILTLVALTATAFYFSRARKKST
jgi:hypothetical protein